MSGLVLLPHRRDDSTEISANEGTSPKSEYINAYRVMYVDALVSIQTSQTTGDVGLLA
jgi:hypothetical protein